jgi:alpha-tubulin suppressor-like RCC1 family protein
VSIAAGESDSCAVVNGGPLKCWGGTFGGVIGSPNDNYVSPTVVPGLEQGVRKVSVGTSTACALTDDGRVECWGGYYSGVVEVTGLPPGIVDIACGAPYFDHTCVITASGGVKCWGSNNFGQLGNGATTPSFTYQYDIVDVIDLPPAATSVSAGSNDTCAITLGGQLSCWGMARYGELGNGTFVSSDTPTQVTGFETGTLAVAAGEEYSCAISALGAVRCWGWVADGTNDSAVPLDIGGVGRATAISADGAACALTSDGALKCWGTNVFNQLGTGTTQSSYTTAVTPVGMSAGVVAVAVGEYNACAVMETGAVKCWGSGGGGAGSAPTVVTGF